MVHIFTDAFIGKGGLGDKMKSKASAASKIRQRCISGMNPRCFKSISSIILDLLGEETGGESAKDELADFGSFCR